MKKIYLISLITFVFIISKNQAIACVDYHPTPPPLTVKIDSTWTKMEIRVHQLNIFAGSTGDFCTCGLASYSDLFDFINYVAFVDSGTTNPVYGFDVWNSNSNSSSEWSNFSPGPTWNGFVAEVINNMIPNTPVELLIRMDLPFGYNFFYDVDSALTISYFGTDQWYPLTNQLAFTHNSISGFSTVNYSLVSPDYFTSINENYSDLYIKIYPNPVTDLLSIVVNNLHSNDYIKIYNLFGQIIYENEIITSKFSIDISSFPSGIYFINIYSDNKMEVSQKLIKN